MEKEIPRNWGLLKSRITEIPGRLNEEQLIGCYPQETEENDPNKCHYFICSEVTDQALAPEGMVKITIPEQRYMAYTFKGPLERYIEEAYEIVNRAIEEQGFKHDRSKFVLEVKKFTNDLSDRTREDNEIELMMPIL